MLTTIDACMCIKFQSETSELISIRDGPLEEVFSSQNLLQDVLANQFLFRGEGVAKIPLEKCAKNSYFLSQTSFSHISALFGPFYGLFIFSFSLRFLVPRLPRTLTQIGGGSRIKR